MPWPKISQKSFNTKNLASRRNKATSRIMQPCFEISLEDFKTDIDSTVSVYWNQREYIYKIYAKEESTYISDYSADLILYTCKYYNSPVRIFRYANRVN